MRLAGLALLAAFAMAADDPPRFVVPNSPDLTVRTRIQGPGGHETVTVRLKGPRQRIDRTYTDSHGATQSAPTMITQCDHRRTLILNPEQKIYGYQLIEDPSAPPRGRSSATTITSTHTAAPLERVTIDAVDTGERRQFGSLIARHVVTTTETAFTSETPPRVWTRVQDGWYVDLPPFGCVDYGGTTFFAYGVLSVAAPGASLVRAPHVTWLGRAKRGFPLIETDRVPAPEGSRTQTTELVEVSTAPLDGALFDVPPDYRAALPIGGGGFDFTRPDTIGNRLSLVWEGLRGFARRWW